MAVTETRERSAETTAATAETPVAPEPRRGLVDVLGSGDHKVTGRLFIGASLLFLAVSGVAGVLIGAERLDAGSFEVLDEDTFGQVFTLHSVAALFLFLLPLLLGLAILIVPLQVGSPAIAFPRAAVASFWTWLISGVLVLTSYALNGGPFGGDPEGVELWTASMAALVVALCVATLCVVTTVFSLRAPGLTLDRAPMFSWSMLVAGTIWLLTLPVFLGLLILSYLDIRYGSNLLGGPTGQYAHLWWVFGQPQVYAFAVPVLGFVADVVPVFSRTPLRSRLAVMTMIGLAGALGFGAWTFIQFEYPDLFTEPLYIGMAFAVLLPVLGVAAVAADTLRRGRIRFGSPLVFAIAALLMLLTAAAAGAAGAIDELDLIGTTWDSGVTHYVLLAAAIAALGGLVYWSPKLFGRQLREGSATLAGVLLLVGTVGLALPELITGVLDQPARLATGDVRDGVEALNLVSLIGGGVLLLGVLVFLGALFGALAARRNGDDATPDDPWEGHTLEWATPSPPPLRNFVELPPIRSATPVLDLRSTEDEA
jgi:heme/copper-type cytochrome/quinol oxidase subunit 1